MSIFRPSSKKFAQHFQVAGEIDDGAALGRLGRDAGSLTDLTTSVRVASLRRVSSSKSKRIVILLFTDPLRAVP